MKKIIYAGIFLDEESKNKLYPLIVIITKKLNWDNYKTICHHMTIAFHTNLNEQIKNWCDEHYGNKIQLTVIAVGFSEKTIAVKVKAVGVPCTNKTSHITLCVNNDTNGKPVDSNYIMSWQDISNIAISGKVQYFYSN